MPIVDVEVCAADTQFHAVSASALAEAVGAALGCAPGHAWIRLRHLPVGRYAENGGGALAEGELPVFVTVLHARLPEGPALEAEAASLTDAIARALDRPRECVHVLYAPAGAGRQAFGGVLVR